MVKCVGVGLVTSNYSNSDEFTEVLIGKKKARPLNALGGKVSKREELTDIPYKERSSYLLESSIEQAMRSASISNKVSSHRIGLVVGTSLGNIAMMEDCVSSNNFSQIQNAKLDTKLEQIAKKYHLMGPRLVISNTCISGINAISVAMMWIEIGKVDACVVCGVDIASEFIVNGMDSNHLISQMKEFQALKKDRDGLILSDGAGTIVLTSADFKDDRHTYGNIIGWGIGNDAKHLVAPDRYGQGMCKAIKDALHWGNVEYKDIDVVLLGANGSNYNDQMYGTVIRNLFEESQSRVSITSLKHFIGHTLGASAIIETIGAFVLMEHQCLCAAVDEMEMDENFKDLNIVLGQQEKVLNNALVLSNGFTGINGALLLRSEVYE